MRAGCALAVRGGAAVCPLHVCDDGWMDAKGKTLRSAVLRCAGLSPAGSCYLPSSWAQ